LKKIKKNIHELNVESNESNHRKCKTAEQDKRAATRTVAHNRIKISVNIVEYYITIITSVNVLNSNKARLAQNQKEKVNQEENQDQNQNHDPNPQQH
jgi:hypothetical protein